MDQARTHAGSHHGSCWYGFDHRGTVAGRVDAGDISAVERRLCIYMALWCQCHTQVCRERTVYLKGGSMGLFIQNCNPSLLTLPSSSVTSTPASPFPSGSLAMRARRRFSILNFWVLLSCARIRALYSLLPSVYMVAWPASREAMREMTGAISGAPLSPPPPRKGPVARTPADSEPRSSKPWQKRQWKLIFLISRKSRYRGIYDPDQSEGER